MLPAAAGTTRTRRLGSPNGKSRLAAPNPDPNPAQNPAQNPSHPVLKIKRKKIIPPKNPVKVKHPRL
jgi:hypothetical protein